MTTGCGISEGRARNPLRPPRFHSGCGQVDRVWAMDGRAPPGRGRQPGSVGGREGGTGLSDHARNGSQAQWIQYLTRSRTAEPGSRRQDSLWPRVVPGAPTRNLTVRPPAAPPRAGRRIPVRHPPLTMKPGAAPTTGPSRPARVPPSGPGRSALRLDAEALHLAEQRGARHAQQARGLGLHVLRALERRHDADALLAGDLLGEVARRLGALQGG